MAVSSKDKQAMGFLLGVVSLFTAAATFWVISWTPRDWWVVWLFGLAAALLAGVWAYRLWTQRSGKAVRFLSWTALMLALATAPFFGMAVSCVIRWC